MTRDEAIEKIRKVLTLTTSSNEHEAALAGETVQRFLAEYRLTLSDVEASEIGRSVLSREGSWVDVLLMIVASSCGCRVLMHQGGTDASVSLFGTFIDRNMAWRLFRQMRPVVEARSRAAWASHVEDLTGPFGPHPATTEPGADVEWMASYAYGMIEVLRKRLVEGHDSQLDPPALALTRTSRTSAHAKVDAYVQQRYGHAITRLRKEPVTFDLGAMREGRREEL